MEADDLRPLGLPRDSLQRSCSHHTSSQTLLSSPRLGEEPGSYRGDEALALNHGPARRRCLRAVRMPSASDPQPSSLRDYLKHRGSLQEGEGEISFSAWACT